jgi:hypothetical protein
MITHGQDLARPLLASVQRDLEADTIWCDILSGGRQLTIGVHLAIFVEPYLQFLLQGKKTVESRFSVYRCAPYERVRNGDLVFVKRSGGPICGVCRVEHVWNYQLDPFSWNRIRSEFAVALCAQDPSFWKSREEASFATLMAVRDVRSITPIFIRKRDRRGWVVLRPSAELNYGLFSCDH